MDPVLVTYDPRQRPVVDLAHHIAARLRTAGWATELTPLPAHPSTTRRLLVVVGAPLHHRRWRRSGRRILRRHRTDLASTIVAVFALASDASSDEALLQAREQLGRSLAHTPELAHLHATVFGRDGTTTPAAVAAWCDELCFALDLATGRAQARAAELAHLLPGPNGGRKPLERPPIRADRDLRAVPARNRAHHARQDPVPPPGRGTCRVPEQPRHHRGT